MNDHDNKMRPSESGLEKLLSPELTLETDDAALREDLADIPEMGNLSALSDAILLLFKNIDERLNRYLTSVDSTEKDELVKEMKQFLDRINSNHLIPLHFRLKVLHSFGREAAFLNAELTSAILKSYQVGILLLLEEANEKEHYLLALGQLCGEAIQLAMHVSRLHLSQYRELGFRITNQVHALARNGLGSLMKCSESIKRLQHLKSLRHSMAWFELMRAADFFSLRPSEQETIYNYIESCINKIDVVYVPKRQAIQHIEDHTYLVSYVEERKQSRPERVDVLQETHSHDRIVLDISILLPILKSRLMEVEEHLEDVEKQRRDLRTEDELQSTLIATKRMLISMHKIPRKQERVEDQQEFTLVGNLETALKMPNKPSFIMTPMMGDDGQLDEQTSYWASYDRSAAGVGAEATNSIQLPEISSLVRLVWASSNTDPQPCWGRMIWRRHLAVGIGRVQAGIQFLPGNPMIITIQSPGHDSYAALAVRLKEPNELMTWMLRRKLNAGEIILIENNGKTFSCQVLKAAQHGSNYSAYRIRVTNTF